jgi:hypothetical protein
MRDRAENRAWRSPGTHTRLGPHKTLLIEQRVLPTVIIKLAGVRDEIQTEAIRMIKSGRYLRVKDVQSLIKDRSIADPQRVPEACPSLKGLLASAIAAAEIRMDTLGAGLEQFDPEDRDLVRWSVQGIRRVATRLQQRRIEPAVVIAWSAWCRAQQAMAQTSHRKRKVQP